MSLQVVTRDGRRFPRTVVAQNLLSSSAGSHLQLLPRLIRLRDAPGYLGMDRNKFNALVRPEVTEIPLGEQAVVFDRLELDAWVDEYICCLSDYFTADFPRFSGAQPGHVPTLITAVEQF